MGLDITISGANHDLDFRKRNWLIPWVEKTIAIEVENCETYLLTKEQVHDLLSDIDTVLEDHDKASEILPIQSGFFYGNTDYDEWYFADLEDAKTRLTELYNDLLDGETVSFWCWW